REEPERGLGLRAGGWEARSDPGTGRDPDRRPEAAERLPRQDAARLRTERRQDDRGPEPGGPGRGVGGGQGNGPVAARRAVPGARRPRGDQRAPREAPVGEDQGVRDRRPEESGGVRAGPSDARHARDGGGGVADRPDASRRQDGAGEEGP